MASTASRIGVSLAEELRDEVQDCGSRGRHGEKECGRKDSHRKYAALVARRPPVFWILAPAERIELRVSYGPGEDQLSLQPRASVSGGRLAI